MVGKRSRRQRRERRSAAVSRSAALADPPFNADCDPASNLGKGNLNQDRSDEISIGRRSDRQSRNTPPMRNAASASQIPAAGETRPWRASETPIREIE